MFTNIIEGGWGYGWLKSRALQSFGTISYSAYLWHSLILYVLKQGCSRILLLQFGLNWYFVLPIFILSAFVAVGLVGWLSYRWLERDLTSYLRQRWWVHKLAP